MALQQYQCFRLKTRLCNVPIHLINDESFVFLDDIQDKFGCNIRSFTFNNHPLTFVRNDRGEREEPLRIRTIINEIIDCDEPQESGIDENVIDKMNRMDGKLDKALENLESLKIKADAILRQTFELAEFTVPRLFIIVPEEKSKLNPANLFRHPYRLFFLCECEQEHHLAFHEGYEVNQPREFIRKYGSYLKPMITVVKCAVGVSSTLVPQLGFIAPNISIPQSLCNQNFWTDFSDKVERMDDVLNKTRDEDKFEFLSGADLREIESFLKKRDTNQTLGNLFRSTTNTGSIRWVCIHHYKKFYSDKKRKELQQQFFSFGGIVRSDEMIIDENGAKNFDKLLDVISRGLYIFKLTLRDCKVRESTFDKMLTLIGERPYIKYLELSSITVSHLVGFTTTHRDIIDKLDATVKQRTDLTIKYIVECPKDKPIPDPNLFDYALKQFTERLILHVYTRDDGRKIVLQDLKKSNLHRLIQSLNQSKTISHCAINEFNRELSIILLNNTTITNLTIFLVKFDEQKVADLKQFLSKRPGLHQLRCSTCENLSPLIMMLSQELVNNVELEMLALNGISNNEQVTELTTMLRKNNHLIELNLALNTNITAQTMIQISQALKINKSLKKFKLTGIQGEVVQQDSSINLFELFFRNTSIEQLILHFYNHKTKISLFRDTIQANENVKILDLNHCNILSKKTLDSTGPISISNILVSLSLHSCELSFEDVVDLFQGLIQNKTLTAFSLINLHIPNNTNDAILSIELAKMLELNTGLQKMTYSCGKLDDEGAVVIGEALKNNKTLEELNISFNQIGNVGAMALANALTINNTLLLLNIRKNNIKYDGILCIFQSLKTNVTLRHLHISKSSYTENLELFNKEKEELFNVNEFINIY
jgi:hypothetical protein